MVLNRIPHAVEHVVRKEGLHEALHTILVKKGLKGGFKVLVFSPFFEGCDLDQGVLERVTQYVAL